MTGLAAPQTQYQYNTDKQLTQILRPDGKSVVFNYDSVKGRLASLTLPEGEQAYRYDPATGRLEPVTTPAGESLRFAYDGSLLLSETWSGSISGSVSRVYDNDFRVIATRVNGAGTVIYQYDDDSLPIKTGDLILNRDPQNGLLAGTLLGNITTQRIYNEFGEAASETVMYNGNLLYRAEYTRDRLGRITQKKETLEGVVKVYVYRYDAAGRLFEVEQDGTVTHRYAYDANGNRTGLNGEIIGGYDNQDRLTQYGDSVYEYTANGELFSKRSLGLRDNTPGTKSGKGGTFLKGCYLCMGPDLASAAWVPCRELSGD
ncbi:MAG: RHS repeat protein [Gammaproteobacteria bacterium]|nr:RHS repeat protein [Gammaproteobacteria bacterium]